MRQGSSPRARIAPACAAALRSEAERVVPDDVAADLPATLRRPSVPLGQVRLLSAPLFAVHPLMPRIPT